MQLMILSAQKISIGNIFGEILINTSLVVCCNNNETQKRRQDTHNRCACEGGQFNNHILFIHFSKYFLDFFIFKLYHSLFSLCVG